jgi:hypothetical protein
MSKVATAAPWKDEFGSEVQVGLKCDIEINIETGATPKDVNATVAAALRALAARIEADELDTGSHPITAPNGVTIGEVYLDHYGTTAE